jgi:tRNA-2-methylthio-N6-dimethylallyladenosine synthase
MTASTAVDRHTRSFHLRVFGCQMNVYDGELMRSALGRRGWEESEDPAAASLHVFHTCSVREQAEERVHGLLGELRRRKREDPGTVVAVVGCMADREGQELFAREPHVDIVCGSRHFPRLPDMVERVLGGEQRVCELGEAAEPVDEERRDLLDRPASWQAHVAVMRGCDLNCTYCIVPSVRGRVESRPAEARGEEVRGLVEAGVTEVHLLGQTIDAYGRDLDRADRPSLAGLLDALEEVDGLARIRMVTLHPSYIDRGLAEAMARSSKFMRFLPVPLQSGSDSVLKRMKRGYTMDLYRRRIGLLREAMPDLELVSDWIVGFPGETDEEFQASLDAMEEIGFLQSYVFQYSPRPGTVAHGLEDDIPKQQKARRNHRMLDLQRHVAKGRTPTQVGADDLVLLEREEEKRPGWWFGRTRRGHYALVPHFAEARPGLEVPVHLAVYTGREIECRHRLDEAGLAALAAASPALRPAPPREVLSFGV